MTLKTSLFLILAFLIFSGFSNLYSSDQQGVVPLPPEEIFTQTDAPGTGFWDSALGGATWKKPWGYNKPENANRKYPLIVIGRWWEGERYYTNHMKRYPAFYIVLANDIVANRDNLSSRIDFVMTNQDFRIDLNRIYLTGFSAGGNYAFDTIHALVADGKNFAAVIRIAGGSSLVLPNDAIQKTAVHMNIGMFDLADRKLAAKTLFSNIKKNPLNASAVETTINDTWNENGIPRARKTILLTKNGIELIRYSEYTEAGHETDPVYFDPNIWPWLFSRAICDSAQPLSPPSVTLTSPLNSTPFHAPATVTLTATASDSDGTITKVEFYNGTTKIGEDTAAPYSYDWENVSAGTYELTARAIDNSSLMANSVSAIIQVSGIPNSPPSISITSPAMNSTFTAPATVEFAAAASDSDGTITKVEFYNGSTKLGEDLSSPYTFTWNNVAANSYNLTAVAFDNAGTSTTSIPVTMTVTTTIITNSTPGTIGIITPAAAGTATSSSYYDLSLAFDGQTTWDIINNRPVNIAGSTVPVFTNRYGFIDFGPDFANIRITEIWTKYRSYTSGNQTPYENLWWDDDKDIVNDNGISENSINFNTAQSLNTGSSMAWIQDKNFGSSPVTPQARYLILKTPKPFICRADEFAIVGYVQGSNPPNTAPSTTLSSPANNASFTVPATIEIQANAADIDGTITKVEFYNGSTKLGEDSLAPYTFTWNNVSAGTYSLTSKAFDNSGTTSDSPVVSVTVNPAPNTPPSTSTLSPLNNSLFTSPANINIEASAFDSDGTITKVEFYNGTTKLGEDSLAPYTYTWNNVSAGTYSLTSRAFDNSGATTDSPTISVTVNPSAAPTLQILIPTGAGTATGSGYFNMADAFDAQPLWDDTLLKPTGGNTGINAPAISSRFGYIDFGPEYYKIRISSTWTRYRTWSSGNQTPFLNAWWDDDKDTLNDNGVVETSINFNSATSLNTGATNRPWVKDKENSATPVIPKGRYLILQAPANMTIRAEEYALVGWIDPSATAPQISISLTGGGSAVTTAGVTGTLGRFIFKPGESSTVKIDSSSQGKTISTLTVYQDGQIIATANQSSLELPVTFNNKGISRLQAVAVDDSGMRTYSSILEIRIDDPLTLENPVYRADRGNVALVFTPKTDGEVSLRIYDITGRLVAQFKNRGNAGIDMRCEWDGKNLSGKNVASDIYFVVVKGCGLDFKRKVAVIR